MRKKVISGALALLTLGTIATLGASPGLVENILTSVQQNVVAVMLSKPVVETAQPTPLASIKTIPPEVLYARVFHLVISFERKANEQETLGQRVTSFRTYFKDKASLSEAENQILRETALEFKRAIEPIDEQAREVIVARRQLYSTGVVPRTEPPPPELVILQEQKNRMVEIYREQLRQSLGVEAYAKLDAFVSGDFADRLESNPIPTQPETIK